ncbi:MAG TPA: methionine--tRNA ligase, partial [Nitrososphaeraceae archaeon]|nr:methionine--tRNA ligase [Nitrososphaeraceae archaeon]
YYKPEELEEKLVIVCTNLSPRTIGKIESKGMILALDGMDGKPLLLTIDKGEKVDLGSRVR